MSVQGTDPNERYLKDYWNMINREGKDSKRIEEIEVKKNTGSIFFVEEGMEIGDFIKKNMPIEAEQRKNPFGFEELNKIVNEMLDGGEFEQKKDIILGKILYLDKKTIIKVLDLLAPNKDEQKKLYEEAIRYGCLNKDDYSLNK